MKNLLGKPYLICWFAVPVLLLDSLLFSRHTIAIQLADTYFVIGNIQFIVAGSLLLLLTGFGYWLIKRTGKRLNSIINALHLAITVPILLMLPLPIKDRFTDFNPFVWSLVALLFGQCVWGIHILLTLFFGTTDPPKL